jgi:hypothetical protein
VADHNDSPYPPTDISDLFAFQKPGDPTKSILIVNVHPDARGDTSAFDPGASYELKMDTDGDLRADIAYHVLFATPDGTRQAARVYRVGGDSAESSGAIGDLVLEASVSLDADSPITEQGGHRFWAGVRSDPFFVDPEGFFNNFEWTGKDANIDKNVLGIVLEVPNATLGASPPIRIWARTIASLDGERYQVDHAGRPGTSGGFLRTAEDARAFNRSHPTQHLALFLPRFAGALASYGFDKEEADALAREYLPDVLSYDYSSAEGYPNGRKLEDDIIDHLVVMLTRGTRRSDALGPHTDLLPHFPYLGPPHDAPR